MPKSISFFVCLFVFFFSRRSSFSSIHKNRSSLDLRGMQLYPALTPYRLTHLSSGLQLALEQGFATTVTEKEHQSYLKRFTININTHFIRPEKSYFKIRKPRLDCIFNPRWTLFQKRRVICNDIFNFMCQNSGRWYVSQTFPPQKINK